MMTIDVGTWGLFAVGAAAGCAWLLLAVTFEAASTSFSALLAACLRFLAPAAVAGLADKEQPQVDISNNNNVRRRRRSPPSADAQVQGDVPSTAARNCCHGAVVDASSTAAAEVAAAPPASPLTKGATADRSDSDATVLSSVEVDAAVAAQQRGTRVVTTVVTTDNTVTQPRHHHHHHRSRNSTSGADVKAHLTNDVVEVLEATGPHSHGRNRSHHSRSIASSNKGHNNPDMHLTLQEQQGAVTEDSSDGCCEDGGKGPDSDMPHTDNSLLNTQPSTGLPSSDAAAMAALPAPSPSSVNSSGPLNSAHRSQQAARLVQSLRQRAAQHHAGIVNADVSAAHASAAAMYARILTPAPYVSRRQRQQVCLKVPSNEPDQLRQDILPALDMVLKQYRHSGPPLSVASVCVREGCVSLVINLARMRPHGMEGGEGDDASLVAHQGGALPLTAANVQALVAALLEPQHRPPCTIEEIESSPTDQPTPAVAAATGGPARVPGSPQRSERGAFGLRSLLPSIFTGRGAAPQDAAEAEDSASERAETPRSPASRTAATSGAVATLGFMSEPLPRIQTSPALLGDTSSANPSSWRLWAQDCQTGTLSCLSYHASSGWTEEVALGPASTPSVASTAGDSNNEAFGGAHMSDVDLAEQGDVSINTAVTEPGTQTSPAAGTTPASHPGMITPAARIMEVTPRVVQGPPLATRTPGGATPRILKLQLQLTHAACVEVSRASGGEGHPSVSPTPAGTATTPITAASPAAQQAPLLSIRARTSSGLSCPVEVLQILDPSQYEAFTEDLPQAMRESKVKIGVNIPPGCTASMIILELWAPVTLLATGAAFVPPSSSRPLPTLLQDQVTVLMVPSPSRRFVSATAEALAAFTTQAGGGNVQARSRALADALLNGALVSVGPVGPGSNSSGRNSPHSSHSYSRSDDDSNGLQEEVAVAYGDPIPGPEPGEWIGVCQSNTSGLPCLCSAQQALYEELASLAEAEAQWARIAGAAGLASADGAAAGGNVVHVRGLGADAAGPVGVAHVDMPGTGTEALLWDVGEVLDCMACCMARLPRQHPELDDGIFEGSFMDTPLNDLDEATAAGHAAQCTTPSSLACAAEVAAGLLEHGSRHGLPGLADVAGRALQLIHEVHLSLAVNIGPPLRMSSNPSGAGPSRAPKPRPGSNNTNTTTSASGSGGGAAAEGEASGSAAPRTPRAPAAAGDGNVSAAPVNPPSSSPAPAEITPATNASAACAAAPAPSNSCCCSGAAPKVTAPAATQRAVEASTITPSTTSSSSLKAGSPLLWALACLLAIVLLACCLCLQSDDAVAAPLCTAVICLLGVLAVRGRRN